MKAIIEKMPSENFQCVGDAKDYVYEMNEIISLISKSLTVEELKENFKGKEYAGFIFAIQGSHMWVSEQRLGNRVIIVHYPKKTVSLNGIREANEVFNIKLAESPNTYSESDRPNFISGYLKL